MRATPGAVLQTGASPLKDLVPVVATGANKQHRLWPAVRSLWTGAVRCLLLLLMIAVAVAPSFACDLRLVPAHNQTEQETEAGETDTALAPPASVARSRSNGGGFTPSNGSQFPRSAGALSRSRQLIPAPPIGAFAKYAGAGVSMRC